MLTIGTAVTYFPRRFLRNIFSKHLNINIFTFIFLLNFVYFEKCFLVSLKTKFFSIYYYFTRNFLRTTCLLCVFENGFQNEENLFDRNQIGFMHRLCTKTVSCIYEYGIFFQNKSNNIFYCQLPISSVTICIYNFTKNASHVFQVDIQFFLYLLVNDLF